MSDTTPETPIPERFEGTVFPYRGQELHGVPMSGRPDLTDQVQEGEDVEFIPLPPEPDPIPVHIVQTGGRELRRWRTLRGYAGDDVTQVLGRDEARITTQLRNLSATAGDRVWIGSDQHTANSAYGFPLDPGASMTLNTEDPIWIRRDSASATNPVPVAVLTEYTIHES
jgi:hypothetical protein